MNYNIVVSNPRIRGYIPSLKNTIGLYIIMVSKHEKTIWLLLDFKEIKSTEQLRRELMKKTKLVINWHLVYRVLKTLEESGRVERFENDAGLFWRKK